MYGMLVAKRAVRPDFFWELHFLQLGLLPAIELPLKV
jgi:hypothetical protein